MGGETERGWDVREMGGKNDANKSGGGFVVLSVDCDLRVLINRLQLMRSERETAWVG